MESLSKEGIFIRIKLWRGKKKKNCNAITYWDMYSWMWKGPGMGIPRSGQVSCEGAGVQDS